MQRAAKWKIPLLVIFGDGHRTKSINPPPNLHHQSLVGGKMTHKSAFRPLRNYFNDVTTIYDLCVLVWNQLVREALKNNPSFFRYILDSKCHFSPNKVCFLRPTASYLALWILANHVLCQEEDVLEFLVQ